MVAVTTPPSRSKYSKVKNGMPVGNFDNVQESRLNNGDEMKFRGDKSSAKKMNYAKGKMKY